jgi:Ran GTPase-activating protein 1
VLSVLRDVCAALAKCSLAEVNLSDNALGEKGIRACSAVLASQKQLKGLYLKNIGCSVNACKAVDELVASGGLETLHLYNNMSDDEGAKSIAALLGRSPNMKVSCCNMLGHAAFRWTIFSHTRACGCRRCAFKPLQRLRECK